MSSLTSTPFESLQSSIRFENVEALWHAMNEVPLDRIAMDPLPGTATENDCLISCERDGRLCELIDGTLVEKAMGFDESLIASILSAAMTTFVRTKRLGFVYGADALFRIRVGRIRLPDVAFVHVEDLPGGRRLRTPIAQLPFRLAVEVLSKSNSKKEIDSKRQDYFSTGTRLMWVIDPSSRTVAVYKSIEGSPEKMLTEHDAFDGEDVLPGFSCEVGDLFRDEP